MEKTSDKQNPERKREQFSKEAGGGACVGAADCPPLVVQVASTA